MTKELGSALAKSVRQVKTQQPQNKALDQELKTEPTKPASELPSPSMPSKRVWPD